MNWSTISVQWHLHSSKMMYSEQLMDRHLHLLLRVMAFPFISSSCGSQLVMNQYAMESWSCQVEFAFSSFSTSSFSVPSEFLENWWTQYLLSVPSQVLKKVNLTENFRKLITTYIAWFWINLTQVFSWWFDLIFKELDFNTDQSRYWPNFSWYFISKSFCMIPNNLTQFRADRLTSFSRNCEGTQLQDWDQSRYWPNFTWYVISRSFPMILNQYLL